MTFDVQKRTAQYVQLRDRIQEIEDAHAAELQPYKLMLNELNQLLLSHLDAQKVDSMKTGAGTVYVSERDSATVADGEQFFEFVRANELWDLLERRASVTAVRAFIEARIEEAKSDPNVQPAPPPGITFNVYRRVGVRRA